MLVDTLHRTWLLVRHNIVLRLRDPAQLISYIFLPMVLMTMLKPLYVEALESGTLQAVTGPLVMFSVFALAIVGHSILVEREWRTWDRLRASRAGRFELLIGKAGPVLLLLILQQAILMTYGCLVVGLPLPSPAAIGYLALAVGVWGLTLLAVGAALATIVRSRGELSVASDLGAILVSALGGALVPVSLMPGWAQFIAPLSPGYWAMELLRGAVDADPAAMLRPTLVCLAIAVVAGAVATYRLARGWGRSRLI
jgi:ABC-2 type transport system permease protein